MKCLFKNNWVFMKVISVSRWDVNCVALRSHAREKILSISLSCTSYFSMILCVLVLLGTEARASHILGKYLPLNTSRSFPVTKPLIKHCSWTLSAALRQQRSPLEMLSLDWKVPVPLSLFCYLDIKQLLQMCLQAGFLFFHNYVLKK